MAKPINWDFVEHLMRTYYPKEYKRILSEQQTKLPLPETKGDTPNDTGDHRPRQKRKAPHHSS